MVLDFLHYPYASLRTAVFSNKGMVATSQPLASQAGLEILKKGGNAVDAAIATAAALTVVEPTSNGIGGDAFAIVWLQGEMFGLNSSGPAPKSLSIDAVKARGHEKMPVHGLIPVTVPGIPGAWATLSKRFGRLPLTEVLQPAIAYAREGYPLSPTLGKYWGSAFNRYKEIYKTDEYQYWFETFAPSGNAPKIGEVWKSEGHATTLEEIAKTNAESFYRGPIANKIATFFKKNDGFLTEEDLASFEPEWVDPISIEYNGYKVWEIPPNGQGIVALMALNIAKGFSFTGKDEVDTYHKQIEALKLALTDGKAYITDPNKMETTISELLSEEYAMQRRAQIGELAIEPSSFEPKQSGTVYLATADGEGNMVSYIQSNYMGFGSGIVIPGTGIAMQNRGADFSLDPNHVNALQGGKRTYHTIIPGFLTKGTEAIGPFGVMGGYMQPQGHMQVVMNLLNFGLNPQAALDAPRWQWMGDKKVIVEPNFPTAIAQSLARRGHQVQIALDTGAFGRGQIILRNPETGVLVGGTESRTDGSIAVW
ncbi:gamma-glutamyltransferase family protein [Caldibacillus lycopersici]|uniref:Gamma-glutamyltransferase family protein n=1 Tax=Perspicuibacillus lycopersici TaxID=1325689 RepID=A0AAE3LMP2_9BACI|nr:gamma-glutamyltransferase family protein [Perspicuibacillus lycopersici]MCU9612972.1 gamma-glutamyltransferase family protein [Perspicuibacillus lycopersici]